MTLIAQHPLILGHRGSPADAPENTLRSFALALDHGADGVELDVQPSADGVPVVIHDDTLDRTTDRRGPLRLLPWETIGAARAAGEPVPRLEQIAQWAAEANAWLNVELKTAGTEAAALRAVREAGILPRAVFSSFVPAAVAEVRRIAPEACAFLLTEQWDARARAHFHEAGAGGVCLGNAGATDPVLRELARAAVPVIVWTVDEPARMRHLLHSGVAALITNQPAAAVAARNRFLGR